MAASSPNKPSHTVRIAAVALAATYGVIACLVGWTVRPLVTRHLVGLALLPGVVAFLAGLPRVLRNRSSASLRRWSALFHLLLYPAVAALTLGLGAALVATRVAEFAGG